MSLLNLPRILSLCLLLLASVFAGSAQAQFQFAPATELISPNSSVDFGPTLSTDNLSLYFSSDSRFPSLGSYELWTATRSSTMEKFGSAVNIGQPVNAQYEEANPDISRDGLSLYFHSTRPGGQGGQDLWVATRASANDGFGQPVSLGAAVNSSSSDGSADISADGLTLVFSSNRPGGFGSQDLFEATRPTTSDPFGAPVNLGPTFNTARYEGSPSLTADGLSLFFAAENRTGGLGGADLWVSSRTSLAAPWGSPVNLGQNVNAASDEFEVDVAWDRSSIVFNSTRNGGVHLYQSAVVPEPSTLVLAACGVLFLAGLAGHRRAEKCGR